jgi:hypothetical protein
MFIFPFAKESNIEKHKANGTQFRRFVNSTSLNKAVATHLSAKEERMVYTIVSGFTKFHLAVGDNVLVNKEPGVVREITYNQDYIGPVGPGPKMGIDYYGRYERQNPLPSQLDQPDNEAFDLDDLGEGWADVNIENILAHLEGDDPKSRAASHKVTIEMDDGYTYTLSTAGELSEGNFQLGYAITGHKSQGSEWDNVFVVIHDCHNTMLSREWLYTAMTRARNKLYIIGTKSALKRAVGNARIKGKTIEEKIAFFNEGYIGSIDLSKLAKGDNDGK